MQKVFISLGHNNSHDQINDHGYLPLSSVQERENTGVGDGNCMQSPTKSEFLKASIASRIARYFERLAQEAEGFASGKTLAQRAEPAGFIPVNPVAGDIPSPIK
jgi:hypothetical protein